MTAPVITGVTFDKTLYEVGDTITMTVTYTSENTHGGEGDVGYTATVTLTDPATGESSTNSALPTGGPTAFVFTVDTGEAVPDDISVSSTDNRVPSGTWTLVSNVLDGDMGTAVLTSVA